MATDLDLRVGKANAWNREKRPEPAHFGGAHAAHVEHGVKVTRR